MSIVHERNFTVQQVAALLQVTDDTVRRWIRDGRLNAFRVGNRWRIFESSLEGLSEDDRQQAHVQMTRGQQHDYERLLKELNLT